MDDHLSEKLKFCRLSGIAEWASIFHDERMTAAIIDRLIHNSEIMLFNRRSYPYRDQQEKLSKND
ncbi:MAG: ATP-binding protein [Bacillota bacterium]